MKCLTCNDTGQYKGGIGIKHTGKGQAEYDKGIDCDCPFCIDKPKSKRPNSSLNNDQMELI